MMTTAGRAGGAAALLSDGHFEAVEMPGIRKAAVLAMALGEELASQLFKGLEETDVQRVTDEITRLGDVCRRRI